MKIEVGQSVNAKFLEDVQFWGGIYLKKGQILSGEVKRVDMSPPHPWISLCGLAVPLKQVQLTNRSTGKTNLGSN